MSNWPKFQLKELCNVGIGRTPRRDNPKYWGNDAIWVTVRELNGQVIKNSKEKISTLAVDTVMPAPIKPGSLLYSFKLSIGKIGIAGVPLFTNEAIASLEIKDESLLNRDFLKFALKSLTPESGANHAVLGMVLNKAKVEALKIPIPPLKVQEEIVGILSEAEEIIALRRLALEKIDALVSSLFFQMFGDPAKNEKNWKLLKFSDLGALDRGKSRHRPRDAMELYGGAYPFIQTGDIANSNGEITEFKSTYSELGLVQSKLWDVETLCITIAANIAKTAILKIPACFPDSVVGFIPNLNVTNNDYVQTWLKFLQPILEANAPQAAQKNINLQILRDLPVAAPPIQLQNIFSSRLEQIRLAKRDQEHALLTAKEMLASLSSKYFPAH